MSTSLSFLVQHVDADVDYATTPGDYVPVALGQDSLLWTSGSSVVIDHQLTVPTSSELDAAATIIDPSVDVTVPLCLLYDYSGDFGGAYYTHKVIGMGENKRFVFCFDFDSSTASEPQLETWDDTTHTTYDKNVLGAGTPANSFVKGVCTTASLPGASWTGAPLAGGSNVLLLNAGAGAIGAAVQLYCNLKIVLPNGYATPASESFILSVRYTFS